MPFTEFYCNPSIGDNRNAGSSESAATFVDTGSYTNASRTFTCSVTPSGFAVGDFVSICQTTKTLTTDIPNIIARVTSITGNNVVLDATAINTYAAISDGAAVLRANGHWLGMTATNSFPLANVNGLLRNANSNGTRVNFKNNAQYNLTSGGISTNNSSLRVWWSGYENTPGDDGMAVFKRASATTTITWNTLAPGVISNIYFLNNPASQAPALTLPSANNYSYVKKCCFSGFVNGAISVSGHHCVFEECYINDFNINKTSVYGILLSGNYNKLVRCTIIGGDSSSGACVRAGNGSMIKDCLIKTNAGTCIVIWTSCYSHIINTLCVGAAVGYNVSTAGVATFDGCISQNMGNYGFMAITSGTSSAYRCIAHNCLNPTFRLVNDDVYIPGSPPAAIHPDGSIELISSELVGYLKDNIWISDTRVISSYVNPFPVQKREEKTLRTRKTQQNFRRKI